MSSRNQDILDSYGLCFSDGAKSMDYGHMNGHSTHSVTFEPGLKDINEYDADYQKRLTSVDMKEFRDAEKQGATITLDISGVLFKAPVDILSRHPHTKLGRLVAYDGVREPAGNNNDERIYRFHRHPGVFQNILDYYITELKKRSLIQRNSEKYETHGHGQPARPRHSHRKYYLTFEKFSFILHRLNQEVTPCFDFSRADGCRSDRFLLSGELHYPLNVCGVIVQRELDFWEIPSQAVQPCCVTQYCSYIDRQAYTATWFIIVLINIVCFCAETMEGGELRRNITIDCGDSPPDHRLINKAKWELRIIDFVSALLFSAELVIRFAFCPKKMMFFRDPMTYVDAFALVPSYVYFALTQVEGYCYYRHINEIELVMFLRVLRVFRITYVLRFYGPFQILVHALKVSGQELLMLATFLTISVLIYGTLIFYIERDNVYLNESKTFPDIPSGLWWAIVTMTTLGYGDKVPSTPFGYVVGSIVAVTGILIVALAVPIVSSNFCKLYDFYNAKKRLKDAAVKEHIFTKSSRVSALENNHEVVVSTL